MIIAAAIQMLTAALQSISDTPRLDAELLLAHVFERPRSFLYAYPEQSLSIELQNILMALMIRRQQGEPIAYLIEQKEFWSLDFIVSKNTLIPRPETEHLVEWVLTHLPLNNITIAELGTGSGAIAIALAHERPSWQIHATDYSLAALTIAIQNAKKHKLNNISFYTGDWCNALPVRHYAAIISNPPYIAPDDPHLSQLSFEPQAALIATDNGFAHFKTIIQQAKSYLQAHGILILEHGYHQAPILMQLLADAEFQHVRSYCDLSKQTRFVVGIHA